MRLIDADVLKRRAMEVRFFERDIMMVPTAKIDDAPTVDAEPVRHAYMLTDEDGNIECSNCGSGECWGNYCMNCGAKMEDNNETD